MQLVEQHIIKKGHQFYDECDMLCLKSKNIYNRSLYLVKESLVLKEYDTLNRLFHFMKVEECFKELPMKVATATIIQVQKNFKSFFKSCEAYKKDSSKFLGYPKEPQFLHKDKGRFITSYNYQTISKKVFDKEHKVQLTKTNIKLCTKIEYYKDIDCVRIIPKLNSYCIEIVYTIPDTEKLKDNKRYAGIDIGLNNLVALTFNTKDSKPLLLSGKPLKSFNQYFNKKKAEALSKLKDNKTSNKIKRLTNKRNNKIKDYMHKSSKKVLDLLKEQNICTLVIGKNDNWKQNSNIGSKNNQNFVSIPHNTFISMLDYKCQKSGIKVILQEESYTSQASFLNNDIIPIYSKGNNAEHSFSGYRKTRGLYKIKNSKMVINADINGSFNILRKAIPKAFANGTEGIVVYPLAVKL